MSTVLYLVVPCYNEEETLPTTEKALTELMDGMIKRGRISEKSTEGKATYRKENGFAFTGWGKDCFA